MREQQPSYLRPIIAYLKGWLKTELLLRGIGTRYIDGGSVRGGTTPSAHALVGALHTAAGLTPGHVVTATGAATFDFAVPSGVTDHGALTGLLDDDHTIYQKESEKGAASGYAGLGAGGYVPHGQLGSGGGGATKFLREDNSWQAVVVSYAEPIIMDGELVLMNGDVITMGVT